MSQNISTRPEKHLRKRSRLHYNSEVSQESLINKELARIERADKERRRQAAAEASWTDEMRNKHLNHVNSKETAKKYAEMKVKVLEEKSNELLEKFLKSMEANPRKNPLEKYAAQIEKFRTIEREYHELMKIASLHHKRYYRDLLMRTSKECPQFARYIDAETFTYCTTSGYMIPLYKLSNEDLAIVQKNIEANPEVFYNDTFKKHYLKYFPAYISRLTEFNDVIFALKLQPSAWLNVPASFLEALEQNHYLFKQIANDAPSALKYMGKAKLMEYGREYCGAIGSAILKDPEILDQLDDRFFELHHPKSVFIKPKAYVIDKLGARIEKFPTLAKHLKYGSATINKSSTDESAKIVQ